MLDTTHDAAAATDEMIQERIEILFDSWDISPDDMLSDDSATAKQAALAYANATWLAAHFPSAISSTVFAEYVAQGLVYLD